MSDKFSKQTTLSDGVDVGLAKQGMCWRGLNRYVHEAMNSISNVNVHLKTRCGNVNMNICSRCNKESTFS